MDEDALQDLRRRNLQDWVGSHGGPTALCRKRRLSPSYPSYISQTIKGGSFAARGARNAERNLGMPEGWLDKNHTTPAQSPKGGHPNDGPGSEGVLDQVLSYTPFQDPPTISWEKVLSGKLLQPLFKLAMPDDALAPRTPRGTVYIFSTEGEPEDGDVVLVKAANGKPCVRLHFDGAGGDWEVRSRDAAHPPMQRVRDGVERLARALFRAGGQG